MKKVLPALVSLALLWPLTAMTQEPAAPGPTAGKDTLRLSLDDCLRIALEKNRQRAVSLLSVEIAQAQRRQALSAYWPQVGLKSALNRRDQDPTTIFPEETSAYSISGVLPQPLQATVTVPEKHIKLLDKTVYAVTADLVYPLYTGGLRGAVVRQAEAGVEAARQEVRRTDLQVTCDVRRFYYGGVLAREVYEVGKEALDRLEVTLELTENLYQKGSGKVKKTDYLKNKVVVESVRSLVAMLEGNEQLARAALVNTMGLDWDTPVELTEREVPFLPVRAGLKDLIAGMYATSPEWGRMNAGLKAAGAKTQEARSGALPKLALLGNFQYLGNSYDKGIVGPTEKKVWTVGVGMQLPLFNGFLTRNQVAEARARLDRMERVKPLVREGLALQAEALYLQMTRAGNQEKAAGEALRAARENCDLTTRAYRDDLVEVEEMIQAQLMEAFAKAQYLKTRYDHYEFRAMLESALGGETNAPAGSGK